MQKFVRAKEKKNPCTSIFECENSHLNILQLCWGRLLLTIYEYYIWCGPAVIRFYHYGPTLLHLKNSCFSFRAIPMLPLCVVSTIVVNVNSLFEGVFFWRQLFIVFYVIWGFLHIQNYECENWSVTLSLRPRVFGNAVLRKIFGPKMEERTGG